MPKNVQNELGVQISDTHTKKSLKFYPTPIKCQKYISKEAATKRERENKEQRRSIVENTESKDAGKVKKGSVIYMKI